MRYIVGMPLWKVVAKLGFKLRLRVVTKYDPDAMCYYVSFSELRGLNTDSESLDSLRANIKESALLFLEDYVKDILRQTNLSDQHHIIFRSIESKQVNINL